MKDFIKLTIRDNVYKIIRISNILTFENQKDVINDTNSFIYLSNGPSFRVKETIKEIQNKIEENDRV